jgi:hypothetical protein
MNASLEEYCLNVCCRDRYPHICEVRRYEFAILRSVPRSKYFSLKAAVRESGGMMQHAGSDQWGFSIPAQSYDNIVNWVVTNELSIHTLLDHLDRLRHFYHLPKKDLGKYCFVDLPPRERWQYFNPESRSWVYLDTMDEFGIKGAFTRAGSILKCLRKGQTEYYKVSDSGSKIYLLQTKRAALNLAAQYFSNKKAYWVEHKETSVIPIRTLGIMPEDIFLALARMRPFRGVADGLLAFTRGDFSVIQEFLKVIKIDLMKCSRLVELPGDKSRTRGTPLLGFVDAGRARVNAIESLIADLGTTVTENGDFLKIVSKTDEFKMAFVVSDAALFHDETLFVPVADLGDASAFRSCLVSLSTRLGRKNADVDKMLAIHWNIESKADAQFVVTIFLKHLDDPKFTAQLLSNTDKFEVIRKWYEDCIATTDFNSPQGFSLHDLLRQVSRSLSPI